MYVYTYMCTFICVHICVFLNMRIHIHACICICICAYIYIVSKYKLPVLVGEFIAKSLLPKLHCQIV